MIRTMLLGLCLINSAQAAQVEHRLWQKVPLNISLPINQERLVYFNEPIKLLGQSDVPALNILKVKDRLYLKAYKSFRLYRNSRGMPKFRSCKTVHSHSDSMIFFNNL